MSEILHIHGHPLSQPARSIFIFCKLSGIPNEFHIVDLLKREHLAKDFTWINPNQEVPAILHGTYNLWESPAIITYIADTFAIDNQWYPKDIKVRGRINAYFHWHHQGCREPIGGYLFKKIFRPKIYGAPELDPETEGHLREKLEGFFETFKWILSDTGYAARTDQATIADVFAYSEIAETLMIGFDLSPYPEVKAWYDQIGAIPEVYEAHETLRNFVGNVAESTP